MFTIWNRRGEWQAHDLKTIEAELSEQEQKYLEEYTKDRSRFKSYESLPPLSLDGLRYSKLDTSYISNGSCDIDITIKGKSKIPCKLVAGHVAAAASETAGLQNTLRPAPPWFMFTKEKTETEA